MVIPALTIEPSVSLSLPRNPTLDESDLCCLHMECRSMEVSLRFTNRGATDGEGCLVSSCLCTSGASRGTWRTDVRPRAYQMSSTRRPGFHRAEEPRTPP